MTVRGRAPHHTVVLRIVGEFMDMPGLRLTGLQAQRLFGMDEPLCITVLNLLVEDGFLAKGADQAYGRASEGSLRRSVRASQA